MTGETGQRYGTDGDLRAIQCRGSEIGVAGVSGRGAGLVPERRGDRGVRTVRCMAEDADFGRCGSRRLGRPTGRKIVIASSYNFV